MSIKHTKGFALQPIGDMVIIEPKQNEQTTASGLVIQSTLSEKPNIGTILAVGPGKLDENGAYISNEVSVGDIVIYKNNDYSSESIHFEGQDLLCIKMDSLVAIITK